MANGCEKCGFQGFYIDDNNKIVRCECVTKKIIQSMYENVGIPKFLFNASFDQYNINETGLPTNSQVVGRSDAKQKEKVRTCLLAICKQIKNVIGNNDFFKIGGGDVVGEMWHGSTIILSGGRSSGKSLLSACIAKEALKEKIMPKIFQWATIVDACYAFKTDNFEEVRYELSERKFIIIENFTNYDKPIDDGSNTSNGSLFSKRRFDTLFEYIYKHGTPTIITTSLTPQQLNQQQMYGPLLSSILVGGYKIPLPSVKLENTHNTMQ